MCNDMNEPRRHYPGWNKPIREGQILDNSTYEVSELAKLTEEENGMVTASRQEEGETGCSRT